LPTGWDGGTLLLSSSNPSTFWSGAARIWLRSSSLRRPQTGPVPTLPGRRLALAPAESRCLTWHRLPGNPSDSLNLARRTAAVLGGRTGPHRTGQPGQTIEIHTVIRTGTPPGPQPEGRLQPVLWPRPASSRPSFVLAASRIRVIPRAATAPITPALERPTALEAAYLAGLLPGAPQLAAGLVRNFLARRPQMARWIGNPAWRSARRWLAAPLLASLAWQTYQRSLDLDFLRAVQPGLQLSSNAGLMPATTATRMAS